jgi:hypothetical protein
VLLIERSSSQNATLVTPLVGVRKMYSPPLRSAPASATAELRSGLSETMREKDEPVVVEAAVATMKAATTPITRRIRGPRARI